ADPYVVDWEDSAPRLAVAAGADAPWYASVAATLVTPADRITADIGCGGGGMAAALAAAMTQGRVLAVDGDSAVLEAAQERLGAEAYGRSASSRAEAYGRSASSRAEVLARVAIEFVLDD